LPGLVADTPQTNPSTKQTSANTCNNNAYNNVTLTIKDNVCINLNINRGSHRHTEPRIPNVKRNCMFVISCSPAGSQARACGHASRRLRAAERTHAVRGEQGGASGIYFSSQRGCCLATPGY